MNNELIKFSKFIHLKEIVGFNKLKNNIYKRRLNNPCIIRKKPRNLKYDLLLAATMSSAVHVHLFFL